MARSLEADARAGGSPGLGALHCDGREQRVVRDGQRGPHDQNLGPGLRHAEADTNRPLAHGARRGDQQPVAVPLLLRRGQGGEVLGPGAERSGFVGLFVRDR